MRDDGERIRDIQEAIERIERYAVKGRQAFDDDELIQTWIIHHLQIIGEAASGLSESFREQYPEIPWTKIVGMRNILVHHYFGIDRDLVWDVIERDMTNFKKTIKEILG